MNRHFTSQTDGGFSSIGERETTEPVTSVLAEHYEKLEPEYQAMVPLKKVYIPVKME